MKVFKYISRGLVFYKKKHLTLTLAVALSTMVLTGALLIGDAVKYSLQNMVEQRLGKVGFALQAADRMITDDLVNSLNEAIDAKVAGIIATQGIAINPEKELNLPQTQVYGVDSNFWNLANESIVETQHDGAYISANLASRISVDSGDFILLRLKVPQVVAINSPFSQEDEVSLAIRVKVQGILHDDNFGRFSLKSDQKAPFNVFVAKNFIAQRLDMQGYVNQVLVEETKELSVVKLNQALSQYWQLSDIGIAINNHGTNRQIVSSSKVFISAAMENIIRDYSANNQSIFTYLVNEIIYDKQSTPYSFVSGVERSTTFQLGLNEVIVNEWLANDLNVNVGDSIQLNYFAFGVFRKLEEKQQSFKIKAIEPNQGSIFNDQLMPNFPGLSEAGSCSEWDTGLPIDLGKIRKKDEDYWDQFKGTPKALINIHTAQTIWENEYGTATGIIIDSSDKNTNDLARYILSNLDVNDVGLGFLPIKQKGSQSAKNGVDFGELFLSLSFFVMVASVLLIIVIFVLNLLARRNEWSTLQALGINNTQIRQMVFFEAGVPLFIGSILGGALGILYNQWLIIGLNTIWHDAVYTHALLPHLNAIKLVYGIVGGIIIGFFSILIPLNRQIKKNIKSVKKHILKERGLCSISSKMKLVLSAVILIFIVFGLIKEGTNPSVSLFLGFLFLLLSIWWFLNALNYWSMSNYNVFSTKEFVLKNLCIVKSRSVLIVTFLAVGVFTILVTGANRKTFSGSENQKSSGTGGYAFWVETSLPLIFDLNTTEGKQKMGLSDELLFDTVEFVSMNRLSGDDASCLNLNLVEQPSILGLDVRQFNQRKAFSFAKLSPLVNTQKPWLFLTKILNDSVIPVYLDQTVIQWGLMKKVGDTLHVINERGEKLNLLIAGGLNASVFQGYMIMDQKIFLNHFPSQAGANIFLIDVPNNREKEVKSLLQFYLNDFGIEIQANAARLKQFNAVTNTYLNIFMLLGGLAVIIGTIGFGVVIFRSLLERENEFATLMALGFRKQKILQLLIYEYSIILFAGILMGVLSAMVGIVPSLLSNLFSMPFIFLSFTILIIILNGLFWIFVPVYFALNNHSQVVLGME